MPFPAVAGGKGSVDQIPANVGLAIVAVREGLRRRRPATGSSASPRTTATRPSTDQGSISGFKVNTAGDRRQRRSPDRCRTRSTPPSRTCCGSRRCSAPRPPTRQPDQRRRPGHRHASGAEQFMQHRPGRAIDQWLTGAARSAAAPYACAAARSAPHASSAAKRTRPCNRVLGDRRAIAAPARSRTARLHPGHAGADRLVARLHLHQGQRHRRLHLRRPRQLHAARSTTRPSCDALWFTLKYARRRHRRAGRRSATCSPCSTSSSCKQGVGAHPHPGVLPGRAADRRRRAAVPEALRRSPRRPAWSTRCSNAVGLDADRLVRQLRQRVLGPDPHGHLALHGLLRRAALRRPGRHPRGDARSRPASTAPPAGGWSATSCCRCRCRCCCRRSSSASTAPSRSSTPSSR